MLQALQDLRTSAEKKPFSRRQMPQSCEAAPQTADAVDGLEEVVRLVHDDHRAPEVQASPTGQIADIFLHVFEKRIYM